MTSSVAGPRRSCKALSKARLAHGHCLVVCCWSDPLQLSESWQNHCIWEVCSANWWDTLKTAVPAASISQHKESSSALQHLTACHRTIVSNVEWIELRSFALPDIFSWPLAASSSITTNVCRENSSITSSVQFSCSVVFNSLRPHGMQYARLPVHHQLLDFTQTHILWVGDAILPFHPLLSSSPPVPNPSQNQSLFQWVNSSHDVAQVLEFQL